MRSFNIIAGLALASSTIAQNVTYCASGNVCFAVNVPATSAATGTGDLYFQMNGPSSMSWISLGQGMGMRGSTMYMVYANAAGDNVTLSPRLGVGEVEPSTSGILPEVTLLSGSGIINGKLVANVKCSNCSSWYPAGSMSLNDPASKWIWAYKSGAAVSSNSLTVGLAQHSAYGSTTFNLQQAAGGNSVNPFGTTVAAQTTGGAASGGGGAYSPAARKKYTAILMAHGILGPIAFAVFYPLGSIAMRLMNFRGLVYIHAGWMIFTYFIVASSLGLGVWLAVKSKELSTYHSIIGFVVAGCLLLQPVTGLAHHMLYKVGGRPNAATYPHIWWGRIVITLGIINGGFGLGLADNTRGGTIAYGVVAGVMWVLWMTSVIVAYVRSRRDKAEPETGDGIFKLGEDDSRTRMNQEAQREVPQMSQAHR